MTIDMHAGTSSLRGAQPGATALDAAGRRVVQLLEVREISSPSLASVDDDPVVTAPNPLHGVVATLKVCVGHTEVSIGQLLGAKLDDVLPLDRDIDDPVDLLLNGVVIGRGTLVAVDGQFGIRLTELPCPLRI
jgi:flagellar motor switch protein FliN/FliY